MLFWKLIFCSVFFVFHECTANEYNLSLIRSTYNFVLSSYIQGLVLIEDSPVYITLAFTNDVEPFSMGNTDSTFNFKTINCLRKSNNATYCNKLMDQNLIDGDILKLPIKISGVKINIKFVCYLYNKRPTVITHFDLITEAFAVSNVPDFFVFELNKKKVYLTKNFDTKQAGEMKIESLSKLIFNVENSKSVLNNKTFITKNTILKINPLKEFFYFPEDIYLEFKNLYKAKDLNILGDCGKNVDILSHPFEFFFFKENNQETEIKIPLFILFHYSMDINKCKLLVKKSENKNEFIFPKSILLSNNLAIQNNPDKTQTKAYIIPSTPAEDFEEYGFIHKFT